MGSAVSYKNDTYIVSSASESYTKSKDILSFDKKWRKKEASSSFADQLKLSVQFDRKESFHFTINNKVYSLYEPLKNIEEALDEASEILSYEYDWDDEGAEVLDVTSFDNAIEFVVNFSNYIYENNRKIVATPYIDILRDGSVSIHWESEMNQLLIIFDKNDCDSYSFYMQYGESENKEFIKGKGRLKENINKIIALWMKDFLTQ